MRVGIVATHPIQYQVPWYRALSDSEEVAVTVYYAFVPDEAEQGVGFDTAFSWDVPLLEGYRWKVLDNTAKPPSLRGFFASRTPDVKEVLKQERPEAIVLTGWHALPLVQALRACRVLGIPVLMRGDSNALKPRPWWTRPLHRILLSRVDAFLAVGSANRRFYRQNAVSEERIFTVPHFVDNERFATQFARHKEDRDRLRRSWGIDDVSTCFLFVGKLIPKKMPHDLLAALDLARRERDDVQVMVVGSGALEGDLRRYAEERNLPVIFTGFLNQTEISRAYVAADCLVLPSDYGETWGLVVNEAMVHGVPAIVSDRVGCGPDLVVEGETGWTFPFGDEGALAERMVRLAADPGRLAEAGHRARERVKEFSVERGVRGTLEALEFVAGAKPESSA